MEGISKPEVTKEEVLAALREKGLTEETMELVLVWTRQQEALADQDPTGRKRLEIDLNKQDFYVAAGMSNDARQNLEELLLQAQAENAEDFVRAIEHKIKSLPE